MQKRFINEKICMRNRREDINSRDLTVYVWNYSSYKVLACNVLSLAIYFWKILSEYKFWLHLM